MTPVTAAAAEAEPRPCEPSPEARLRALAAWIEADPGAPVELSIALFRPSVTVEGIVARSGGSVREGSGTEALGARVPRRALIPLGDADDVRSIEPTAEGSPAAGLPQGP